MAIEIHLTKSDNTPWGFRLTGGADFDFPLTVVKVTEESIAHRAGLQTGDVVIRINKDPLAKLSHAEAHDVILQAGPDFIMGIRRDELTELQSAIIAEEQSNDEVYNILEGSIPIDYPENKPPDAQPDINIYCKHDLNLTDEEIHSIINPDIVTSNIQRDPIKALDNSSYIQEIVDEAQAKYNDIVQNSEVLKIVNSNLINENEADERKWSTFLVKPKGPKPFNQKDEDEAPKIAPYRIKIRTKKDLQDEIDGAKRAIEEAIELEAALEAARIAAEEAAIAVEKAAEQAAIEEEIRLQEELIAKENEAIENTENNNNEIDEDFQEISEADSSKRQKSEPLVVILTIEQQLAQVKEQLAALSALPIELQETLNAVTQQLQRIVRESQHQLIDDDLDPDQDDQQQSFAENTDTTEDDVTEYLVTDPQEVLSVVDEENEIAQNKSTQEDDSIMESQHEDEEAQAQLISEEQLEALRIEEAKRLEQEKVDKKEKGESRVKANMDQPLHPLTPLERPIILPGGRKWCQPDDATRGSKKQANMSDDKIDETISTSFEVIVGHTVGINFLKYQPPPKNLDHLQKSEVYKMIHDMDPPPRGIIARPGEKVLAEQDYYVQDDSSLPQMER